ncbi:MAG: ATP-binding cassette domain-containing protein [Candidatus Cloacimonetes bacterium]|nr:ATP-binding cassette domain-containing protein [Candidatus Cloacimonadota bacterium]
MIEIKNISKLYESKRRLKHKALDNINLDFPSKGMIFLLGKSGSGKTTLLNIIGALDSPSNGEIFFNNVKIQPKREFLDHYRNQYIGFVFQEFNLIESETVFQNTALAMQLQNKRQVKELVASVLKQVGLEGFENRMPDELSGGEKQRITIARALVKNSKIILADEPTGNLDSENGESIFELLKSISENKLVIAVTHDRECAKKYGERIIEISDGKIISDTDLKNTYVDKNNQMEELLIDKISKSKFPSRLAFKLGFLNLGKRKARSILTIFIAILSIFSMTFAHVLTSFSSEKALSKTISENDVEYIGIYQNTIKEVVSQYSRWRYLNDGIYEEELEDVPYIKITNDYAIINSKQQLLDFGLEFYCVEELTNDSVYVTDYLLDRQIFYGLQVSLDGENYIEYDSNIHSYEWLIGKYAKITNLRSEFYKLAGIVKTNYKEFYDESFFPFEEVSSIDNNKLYQRRMLFQERYYLNNIYCTEFYLRSLINYVKFDKESSITAEVETKVVPLSNITLLSSELDVDVLTSSSLVSINELNLSPSEIVVSSDLYNRLFDNEIVFDFDMDNLEFPQKLGTKIRFNVHLKETNDITFSEEEFIISGVKMDPSFLPGENQNYYIYVNKSILMNCAENGFENNRTLIKLSENENDNYQFLKQIRENENVVTDFVYSETIYDNEQTQRNVGYSFLVFGIVMSIITVLIMISLISFSVVSQKKEIGILRAMGASAQDIKKIYLFESLIISVIVFVISLLLTITTVNINNSEMSKATLPNTIFISFEFLSFVALFLASLVLINVATLLPLIKISKMKPIDAIKN